MNTQNTWICSLVSLVCASAPVGQTVAQGKSGVTLEEVMVTASRREQSLQDVPASVTTFDPQKFLKTGLTSIEDMIDYSPGATFVNGSAPGQGQVVLRGIGQEGGIPVTGIYIDDMPITSASPFAAASDFFFDGLLGDLERIEIVKGPQGTLYGAGAMGGVVKYVTRDPAMEEMRGSFSIDIATTKHGDDSELYRGMISVPVIKDRLGVTISGFRSEKGGYIDRLDPATLNVVEEDYNSAEISGFSAAVLWNISDRARLKLSGLTQETETFGTNEVALFSSDIGNQKPDFTKVDGRLSLAANEPGTVGLKYTQANITFNYDLEWAQFTSVSGYAEYETPTVTDQGNIPGLNGFIDTILGLPAGSNTGIPTTFYRDSERFVQELRLSSSDNEKIEWIAGIFYAHEDTNNIQDVRAVPSDTSLIDVSFPSTYEEVAFFGDITYYMTPEIDFTVGMRFGENSLDSEFDFNGLLVGPPSQTTADVSEKVTTYLFNARWRPSDDISLYASIASGYRPAYVNTPITDPNTGATSSSVIDSDSLWNYEVGIKGASLNDRVTYELSLWYVDWDDFQAGLRLGGVNTGGNSDSPMVASGFESSLQLRLTSHLDVSLGVAHVNSELEGDSPALGALDGEQTRSIPEWTASMQGNFYFDLGSVSAVSTLGVRYVGDYNTVYLGGYSAEFDTDVSLGTFEFPIEDYFLVDFSTEFTGGNISLNVYANNLFNEYTYLNGFTVDVGTGVSATGYANEPRRIGVSLTYAF
ncbi:MAG: TonB-dependent receptor [Pseudomonadales bacterium]